jgi:aspartyl-tRNA(Asn)/glutamyl-tRNA(Gln) amidotransferase subunit C
MSLDIETVKNIALLARIRVADETLEPLARELSAIIGWVEELAEVDTDAVAPMTSVTETAPDLRDDVVTDGDRLDAVLANAPDGADAFYTVPKVVE